MSRVVKSGKLKWNRQLQRCAEIWHISHLHSIGFPEPHGGGAGCAFVEDSDTVIL